MVKYVFKSSWEFCKYASQSFQMVKHELCICRLSKLRFTRTKQPATICLLGPFYEWSSSKKFYTTALNVPLVNWKLTVLSMHPFLNETWIKKCKSQSFRVIDWLTHWVKLQSHLWTIIIEGLRFGSVFDCLYSMGNKSKYRMNKISDEKTSAEYWWPQKGGPDNTFTRQINWTINRWPTSTLGYSGPQ